MAKRKHRAESQSEMSPESVCEQFFAIVQCGNFDNYVKLVAPGELGYFKNAMLRILEMADGDGKQDEVLSLFDATDIQSVEALAPEEVFRRIVGNQLKSAAGEGSPKPEHEMLGRVMEDDIAHCVYRLKIPDLLSKIGVVSLKPVEAGWGLLLTNELESLMQQLTSRLAVQRADGSIGFSVALQGVKLLGSVLCDEGAVLVCRSTTVFNGSAMEKVGQITITKEDPQYRLVEANNNAALQIFVEAKFEEHVTKLQQFCEMIAGLGAISPRPDSEEGPCAPGPDTSALILSTAHTVSAVAFSPDGKWLVSAASCDLELWNPMDGQLLNHLHDYENRIGTLAWSPDSTHVVFGDNYGALGIWYPDSAEFLHCTELHVGSVTGIQFSANGQIMVSSGGTNDGALNIYAPSFDKEYSVKRRIGPVMDEDCDEPHSIASLALSSDGMQVAAGYSDGWIRIWDSNTGENIESWPAHDSCVYALAFSLNDQQLASASSDDVVKVWAPNDRMLYTELLFTCEHAGIIQSIRFSPDGRFLASASSDKTIKVWDVETFNLKNTLFGHTDWIETVVWSPDGKRLASGGSDETIRIWDIET